MAKTVKIKGFQHFTENGKIGMWLFIISPIVSAGCYVWWLREIAKSYGNTPGLAATIGFVAGVAFLVSIPLMLIGRSQTYTVTSDDNAPSRFE